MEIAKGWISLDGNVEKAVVCVQKVIFEEQMEETSVLDTNYVLHEHHALIKLALARAFLMKNR